MHPAIRMIKLVQTEPNALESEQLDSRQLDIDFIVHRRAGGIRIDHECGDDSAPAAGFECDACFAVLPPAGITTC